MKVIYIAGPYRASSIQGVIDNINHARKIAVHYWKEGWAVICPHSNTALFDGLADDSVWLDGDLEILKRCDAICMLSGWYNSSGASKEYDLARELGLEMYFEEQL